jgi:hypothetical protein
VPIHELPSKPLGGPPRAKVLSQKTGWNENAVPDKRDQPSIFGPVTTVGRENGFHSR